MIGGVTDGDIKAQKVVKIDGTGVKVVDTAMKTEEDGKAADANQKAGKPAKGE